MKEIFIGCVVLVVGFLLLSLCGYVAIGLRIFNLPLFNLGQRVDLNYGVIDRTFDTDYCLANYEWFKDRWHGIQSMDEKIAIQRAILADFRQSAGPRKNWTFEDKQTDADLASKLAGVENIRSTYAAEYNSRAEQLHRVACKELPLFINPF